MESTVVTRAALSPGVAVLMLSGISGVQSAPAGQRESCLEKLGARAVDHRVGCSITDGASELRSRE